jgi:hypothetical protein
VTTPHPQDNDDEILQLKEPVPGNKDLNDDDVVMVTLRKFDALNVGKIRLSTSSNSDVRFFAYTDGDYNLDAVNIAELVVDLANPGTSSPLKDLPKKDIHFYIEGLKANDDLAVQMILENKKGQAVARREVHLQIKATRQINVTVLPHGSLSDETIGRSLTRLFQGANQVREDKDGLDASADNAAPVVFRLSELQKKDSKESHSGWRQVGRTKDERNAILKYLRDVNVNIYLTESISYAGGFAKYNSNPKRFVVAVNGSGDTTIAHEWLHAFANADHVCTDGNIMVNEEQDPCSNGAKQGTNTSPQDVLNLLSH